MLAVSVLIDQLLMFLIGSGEGMGAGGRIQNIVIVIGVRGIQSSFQTGKTGVGNGTGGKTHVGVSVVGMVDLQIFRTAPAAG